MLCVLKDVITTIQLVNFKLLTHTSELAPQKDRGALRKASIDVQTICIETEKNFRTYK